MQLKPMTLAVHQTKKENIESILKNGLTKSKYEGSDSPYDKKSGVFLFPFDSIDSLIQGLESIREESREHVRNSMYVIAEVDDNSSLGDCNLEGDYHRYCDKITTLHDYIKNKKRNQYEEPEIFIEKDIKPENIMGVYNIFQLLELYDKCNSQEKCIRENITKNKWQLEK